MRTRSTRLSPAILILIVLALPACTASGERYTLTVAGEELHVEVVDTVESRTRGLMERTELAERHGMLFVFETSEQRSFWMKNTPLPLSIAYIDERWTIREIHHMEPYSLEPVASRSPARYALEVNQGAFERLGIEAGDRIVPSPKLRSRIKQ